MLRHCDDKGRVTLPRFRPAVYRSLWLEDEQGRRLWQAEVQDLDLDGTIEVALNALNEADAD